MSSLAYTLPPVYMILKTLGSILLGVLILALVAFLVLLVIFARADIGVEHIYDRNPWDYCPH